MLVYINGCNAGVGVFNDCGMGAGGLPDICSRGPRVLGLRVDILGSTSARVVTIECNTFTPQIKGICCVTNLTFPSPQGIVVILP